CWKAPSATLAIGSRWQGHESEWALSRPPTASLRRPSPRAASAAIGDAGIWGETLLGSSMPIYGSLYAYIDVAPDFSPPPKKKWKMFARARANHHDKRSALHGLFV